MGYPGPMGHTGPRGIQGEKGKAYPGKQGKAGLPGSVGMVGYTTIAGNWNSWSNALEGEIKTWLSAVYQKTHICENCGEGVQGMLQVLCRQVISDIQY